MDAEQRLREMSEKAKGGTGRASWENIMVKRSMNNRAAVWYVAGKRVAYLDAVVRARQIFAGER